MNINVYTIGQRTPQHKEDIYILRGDKLFLCYVSYPAQTEPKKYCKDFFDIIEFEGCRDSRSKISYDEFSIYILRDDVLDLIKTHRESPKESKKEKFEGYAT